MPILNPPPQVIPAALTGDSDTYNFVETLKNCVFTLWAACGGHSENPFPTLHMMSDHDSGGAEDYNELTGHTGVPEVDPGWEDSDTVGLTPPDKYIKFRIGTVAYMVPAWLAPDESGFLLLEDDGKIALEDDSGFIIGEET